MKLEIACVMTRSWLKVVCGRDIKCSQIYKCKSWKMEKKHM